ncbi:MAG TPA: M23 family metallopeptidase [Actinomycetota bacterium]|nr:M23 family metallopeptidase [Actinomycetota bacterium]
MLRPSASARRVAAATAVVGLVLTPPAAAQPQPGGGTRIGELKEQERQARSGLAEARRQLDAAVSEYEAAQSRMAEAARRLRLARERSDAQWSALADAKTRLELRAVSLHREGRLKLLDALLQSQTLSSFVRRATYMAHVAGRDAEVVRRVEVRHADAEAARAAVRVEAEALHADLRAMSGREAEIDRRMQDLSGRLERVKSDILAEQSKFRFPVKPPYSFTDTFGAPRMTGTEYEHLHEGQDIFAPMGAPVVAVVAGVVENAGEAVLGGTKLWLRGDDGFRYYYAHLSAYAPAGSNGARVDAGTEIGYVGDTGNAKGTPPHLHFEIHSASGAINPYATLRAAESAWGR